MKKLLLALLFPALSNAADFNLAWDPSPSTILGGYQLGCGAVTKVYTTIVDVKNVTTYKHTGVVGGRTTLCAVRAYNAAPYTAGNPQIFSVWSNEIALAPDLESPTNLRAQLVQALRELGIAEGRIASILSQWPE